MQMTKKLSIISIAYNNYQGLRKTLKIFESNVFAEYLEIIIVDGGSKDETPDYLAKQTITQNWVSEPDKGIYDAMNKGLEMATGDYVWFLNSGDYVYNTQVLATLIIALENEPDACYGETMLVNTLGKEIGTRSAQTTRTLPSNLTWKSFKMGMNVGHQAFIVKRKLAEKYNTNYRHVADIDWMIATLRHCRTIINTKITLVCFTLDGHSTKHRKASNRERFWVLGKYYGHIQNLWNHLKIGLNRVLLVKNS